MRGWFVSAVWFGVVMIMCSSCQMGRGVAEKGPYVRLSPDFCADSAYDYVFRQVEFGPRVPGTDAHELCGNYLIGKLSDFGAEVIEQRADVTHYDGSNVEIRNIIGSYNTGKKKRILLFAHWDSRPFADMEKESDKQRLPIDGADDGASGVGVLLEIARQLGHSNVNIGVDIIFFDMEDWGQPSFDREWLEGNWWCIGSQYWSANPHFEDYNAEFGILLDMVGGTNPTFYKEGYSMQYAKNVVEKVWSTAINLGYGDYFLNKPEGYITDDHVPINESGLTKCIDIINLKKDSMSGFVEHWHTHKDDMRNIDKKSLEIVGQTLLEVLYKEDKRIYENN
ncbi:MAG: M28 family peptidase [Fermentimonas sp.]|jgi:glutaminyl-peptide cyclotransferase